MLNQQESGDNQSPTPERQVLNNREASRSKSPRRSNSPRKQRVSRSKSSRKHNMTVSKSVDRDVSRKGRQGPNKVFVGALSRDITASEIKEKFANYGHVIDV